MKKENLTIHDNLYKAYEWFWNYQPLNVEVPSFIYGDTDWGKWKFGDYFLFQHIQDGKQIGRPRLGIFCKWNVCDQAAQIDFVENDRAWMKYHGIITNHEINYKMPLSHLVIEPHSIIFWNDDIHLLGHWTTRPTIGELKTALTNKI